MNLLQSRGHKTVAPGLLLTSSDFNSRRDGLRPQARLTVYPGRPDINPSYEEGGDWMITGATATRVVALNDPDFPNSDKAGTQGHTYLSCAISGTPNPDTRSVVFANADTSGKKVLIDAGTAKNDERLRGV